MAAAQVEDDDRTATATETTVVRRRRRTTITTTGAATAAAAAATATTATRARNSLLRTGRNRVHLPHLRVHPQHRHHIGRSLGLLLTFAVAACGIAASGPHGPVFVHEPLDLVEFSNTTGARVECKASGNPDPTVSWLLSDGSPISNVPGLRHSMPDGTLVFPPFRAEDYRQDVHAVVYRCAATNTAGTLVSRDVKVKAVVVQPYEVYVYDVYVIRGNSAVMKCHVPNFLQDYVSVTSWVKDKVFAIPTAKIEENGKYVILDGGNLIVNHVGNEDDKNAFSCQTKHRLTGEVRTSVKAGTLYVTDPQGSVPPRISASEITVTSREGRTAVIACVTQGHPSPTTVWFTQIGHGNLHPLSKNRRILVKNSALIIKSLRTEDTGVYVCEASNTMGTERAYTRLVVLTSLSVKIQPAAITADIGNSVTFHCQASGLPAPTITWLKDGTLLPAEDVHFQDAHALTIKSVTSSHRGIYQCLAKNDFTSAQGMAELKLGDTPPELHSVFDEQVLHPGSSLSLRCVATGTPTPQLSWALDDIPVTSVRTQSEGEDRVVGWLNVSKVRTDDSGVYSCTASNKAGTTRHSSRINIHGPLSTRVRPPFKAVADQSAVLHCPIIGYPWDSITWEKDGFQLPVNHRQNVFKNGTLVVENVRRPVDGGKYLCTAVNKKTNHNVKAEIEVTVMVPPQIVPFAFQDGHLLEGMLVRVTCVVNRGDPPLNITWLKDGRPLPTDLSITIRDFDQQSSVLSIDPLSVRHNGNYSCVVQNPAAITVHTAKLVVNGMPRNIIKNNPRTQQKFGIQHSEESIPPYDNHQMDHYYHYSFYKIFHLETNSSPRERKHMAFLKTVHKSTAIPMSQTF